MISLALTSFWNLNADLSKVIDFLNFINATNQQNKNVKEKLKV